MRTFIVIILLSCSIFAQELKDNILTVYGIGQIEVPADQARISFSVKGLGSSLSLAIADADKKMEKLTKQLFELGLSAENLSTQHFNSQENFGGSAFFSSEEDFITNIKVYVIINKLELIEKVIIALTNNGIENVSNVRFEMMDTDEIKMKTRAIAARNAYEKAKIFANELKFSLGDILYVEELPSSNSSDFRITSPGYGIRSVTNATSVVTVQGPKSSFFAKKFTFKSGVKVVYSINYHEQNKPGE